MASCNVCIAELCPSSNYYGTGLGENDAVMRSSSCNMSIRASTQSNALAALTVNASKLAIQGSLDFRGALTKNGQRYGQPYASATQSNFTIIFKSSNVVPWRNGLRSLPETAFYVEYKSSNCGYNLSNIMTTAGFLKFPANGIYTVSQQQAMSSNAPGATCWFDPYVGFGYNSNNTPPFRLAQKDSPAMYQGNSITTHFLATDVVAPRCYTGAASNFPTLSNGGTAYIMTMHQSV